MTKNNFLLSFMMLAILAFFSFSSGDDNRPGYIILKDGTKKEGQIEVGSLTDLEVKLKFYEDGKKKVYKPGKVIAYGYESIEIPEDEAELPVKKWKHYETVKTELEFPPKVFAPKKVFMLRTVEGHFTLYNYYYEQPAITDEPMGNCYYLKYGRGKLTKIDKKNFKKKAKRFFKAYTAMYDQIGKPKFRFDNLERLVKDYNYWQINQHDINVYKMSPENFNKGK